MSKDIINKINILIGEEGTVTADVEQNLAKGHVDVIGGECPKGYVYDKKKKVCVLEKDEKKPSNKKEM